MKHKHCDLMMMYAQDAMETDKPWERWECGIPGRDWQRCSRGVAWEDAIDYRRRPKQIVFKAEGLPKSNALAGRAVLSIGLNCNSSREWWDLHYSDDDARRVYEALVNLLSLQA